MEIVVLGYSSFLKYAVDNLLFMLSGVCMIMYFDVPLILQFVIHIAYSTCLLHSPNLPLR